MADTELMKLATGAIARENGERVRLHSRLGATI